MARALARGRRYPPTRDPAAGSPRRRRGRVRRAARRRRRRSAERRAPETRRLRRLLDERRDAACAGVGTPPREIAERLGEAIQQRLGAGLAKFEVAGPGFLNLFLADSRTRRRSPACSAGERFGGDGADGASGSSSSSSAPTRPGRSSPPAAATPPTATRSPRSSPSMAMRCSASTTSTTPAGRCASSASRCRRARSASRCRGRLRGRLVAELAVEIADSTTADPDHLAQEAVAKMLEPSRRRSPASASGTTASSASSPSTRGSRARSTRFALLEASGHAYRSEGALWLRTTSFGDDKDRVLERANGEPTYFASDCAYLLDKQARGFDRQVNVFGADHHGYVARLRGAFAALGGDPDAIELRRSARSSTRTARTGPDGACSPRSRISLARRGRAQTKILSRTRQAVFRTPGARWSGQRQSDPPDIVPLGHVATVQPRARSGRPCSAPFRQPVEMALADLVRKSKELSDSGQLGGGEAAR